MGVVENLCEKKTYRVAFQAFKLVNSAKDVVHPVKGNHKGVVSYLLEIR